MSKVDPSALSARRLSHKRLHSRDTPDEKIAIGDFNSPITHSPGQDIPLPLPPNRNIGAFEFKVLSPSTQSTTAARDFSSQDLQLSRLARRLSLSTSSPSPTPQRDLTPKATAIRQYFDNNPIFRSMDKARTSTAPISKLSLIRNKANESGSGSGSGSASVPESKLTSSGMSFENVITPTKKRKVPEPQQPPSLPPPAPIAQDKTNKNNDKLVVVEVQSEFGSGSGSGSGSESESKKRPKITQPKQPLAAAVSLSQTYPHHIWINLECGSEIDKKIVYTLPTGPDQIYHWRLQIQKLIRRLVNLHVKVVSDEEKMTQDMNDQVFFIWPTSPEYYKLFVFGKRIYRNPEKDKDTPEYKKAIVARDNQDPNRANYSNVSRRLNNVLEPLENGATFPGDKTGTNVLGYDFNGTGIPVAVSQNRHGWKERFEMINTSVNTIKSILELPVNLFKFRFIVVPVIRQVDSGPDKPTYIKYAFVNDTDPTIGQEITTKLNDLKSKIIGPTSEFMTNVFNISHKESSDKINLSISPPQRPSIGPASESKLSFAPPSTATTTTTLVPIASFVKQEPRPSRSVEEKREVIVIDLTDGKTNRQVTRSKEDNVIVSQEW